MSRKNVDVVREMNAAFNAGAYHTLAEFFHPDAEFVDHLPLPDMPASARSREEIRATMDAWREGFSGFEAHVAEYVDLGDFVMAVTRWRFVSADRGVDTSWKGAEAWQLRDGKVVWGQAGFRDRDSAVAAVRLRRDAAPKQGSRPTHWAFTARRPQDAAVSLTGDRDDWPLEAHCSFARLAQVTAADPRRVLLVRYESPRVAPSLVDRPQYESVAVGARTC